MVNQVNPLHVVLERLGCADPATGAFFFWDEVKDWPAGALDVLVTNGLLQPAQPTAAIECDGCEENCIMPVTVYPAQEDKPGRAFITCDKRDDIGRVRVDFRRMEQWQTTGGLIATTLARLLELSQPSNAADGGQWRIGTLKGRKHKSPVTLLAGDSLTLALSGHTAPLVDMLTFEENALALDKAALIRLVDNPAGDAEAEGAEEIEARGFDNDGIEKFAAINSKPSVSASDIRWKYTVIKSEDANDKWWRKMMRNASDNGLRECRNGGGKTGRGGSLWRPDLVAGWLVDRHERNFEGMGKNAARAALKKFSEYVDIAEELFPSDE